MRTQVEIITAERARQLLSGPNTNRSTALRLVEAYARDMKAGAWAITPQGIVIREGGSPGSPGESLEDGKHRCQAVIRAAEGDPGFGVEMVVTYLEPGDRDIRMVLDTGRSRTFADLLKMDQREDSTQLAAVTRRLWDWDQGQPWMRTRQATRHELYKLLDSEPDLAAAAKAAHGWKAPRILTPALAGFAWFLFRNRVMMLDRKDSWVRSREDTSRDARWFLEHLELGNDLEEGSPLLAFRNRQLAGDRMTSFTAGGKSANTALAALVTTWNHYRDHSAISKVQLPRTVSNRKFPVPH